jgi:hypothetical protein
MLSMIADLITEFFELEAELADLESEHRTKLERMNEIRDKLRGLAKGLPTPEPERSLHPMESVVNPGSICGDF